MSGIAENKCEASGIRRRPKQEGYDRFGAVEWVAGLMQKQARYTAADNWSLILEVEFW